MRQLPEIEKEKCDQISYLVFKILVDWYLIWSKNIFLMTNWFPTIWCNLNQVNVNLKFWCDVHKSDVILNQVIDITDIDNEWPPIVNLKSDVIIINSYIFLLFPYIFCFSCLKTNVSPT